MLNKRASLTPEQLYVIDSKGTEPPFSGKYLSSEATTGTYLCRACGLGLFRADSQFTSSCGWPSFDDEISLAIKRKIDADGRRTEILCTRCDAHLGHVFSGENLTERNLRHCVNSISIEFVSDDNVLDTEEAIVAAGCFWGVEYLFQQLSGVLKTEVGYTGGHTLAPTYPQICEGETGHVEAIRVVYDTKKLSYQEIIKYFFEIHDPTQVDGQGPDRGSQYFSQIFYYDAIQQQTSADVMAILTQQGLRLATRLLPVNVFWPAEDYHQDYYNQTGKKPYCHVYQKRF